MNINHRGPGWPPIYFEPTFEEMLELTKSFDTLRIGMVREKGEYYLVIASGFGNTHSTLSRALGELNPRCRPSRIDGLKYNGLDGTAILYEEDRKFWFNMNDLDGGEKETVEEALRKFPYSVGKQLREIVKLAYEQMNPI